MSRKQNDLQWENRVLCSDESCIGVIGPDGRCKECGLAYEGDLPSTFHLDSSEESDLPEISNDPITHAANDSTDEESSPVDADDEWARRKLCVDESCIGVVGPDGNCKECGKPYPE